MPWFVLVQRANPEFFDLFFVQVHFRRYLEPGHHRPGPWWYFIPIVAAGLLPWTGALPDGIAAEPEKYIEHMSDFEARWRAGREAYAVMSPATYRELAAAGLPMTVMAADPRRVFVARGRWPHAADH